MFCQNCGAFDTEEAKFCSRCGESLSEVTRRGRFPLLRIWKDEAFLQGFDFLRVFLDFSSRESSLKAIEFLYRLSILSVAFSAILFIVIAFKTSERFGLITLLMIVILGFLFVAMCGRIIIGLGSILSQMESPQTPRADDLESKEQIEWNIE